MALTTALVAATVASTAISASSAKKARKAQSRAADSALDFQRESRDQQLALQAPQRQAGYAATAALMDLTGLKRTPSSAIDMAQGADGTWKAPDLSSYAKYDFTADPGYQFRLSEGNKAIEHSLVARAGALSGAATKSALRYAQNYASNEYKNVYDRIATIAGLGAQATNASGNAIQQAGNAMTNTALDAGAARASSYVAQGNAYSSGINQIAMLGGMGAFGGGGFGGSMANNYVPKYGAYA